MDDNQIQQEEQVPDIKHIFESKTFQVNGIAIIAWLIQAKYGFVIDADIQGAILSFVNIVLRSLTTCPVRIK